MNHKNHPAGLAILAILGAALGLPHTANATNMQIVVTYDNSVTSLSNASQFETAFGSVVSAFEAAITNPITVDITVSSGTVHGSSLNGDVSSSWDNTVEMGSGATAAQTYANVTAALQPTETSLGYVLPSSDPTGGGHYYYMPSAEVKALGVTSSYPVSGQDGYIGFSSASGEFYYGTTPVSGEYSFLAAAAHELEEVLGRTSILNNGGTSSGFIANPLDLFRYSATGVTSFSENAAAYASVNGGVTSLGSFENVATGLDRSDWLTPSGTTSIDAQNSRFATGTDEGLSISDEDLLQALGYQISSGNGDGLFSAVNAPVGASAGVNQVPEPASVAFLGLGAGLVALLPRRSRRRLFV